MNGRLIRQFFRFISNKPIRKIISISFCLSFHACSFMPAFPNHSFQNEVNNQSSSNFEAESSRAKLNLEEQKYQAKVKEDIFSSKNNNGDGNGDSSGNGNVQLQKISILNKNLEKDFLNAQRSCYQKYWVNYCLQQENKKIRIREDFLREMRQIILDREESKSLMQNKQAIAQHSKKIAKEIDARNQLEKSNLKNYQTRQEKRLKQEIQYGSLPTNSISSTEIELKNIQKNHMKLRSEAQAASKKEADMRAENVRRYEEKIRAAQAHKQRVLMRQEKKPF